MRRLALTAALALIAAPAFAHTGHSVGGLVDGALHPMLGLDHLLAMVAVGLWAAQLQGRLWLLPATFMGAMAVGAGLALAGFEMPLVETGISGSIIVLGLVVAIGKRIPATAAMGVVGAFALFHGFAHGAEMPELASPTLYSLGFLAATGLLHLAGVYGGLAATRFSAIALRAAGAAVVVAGGALLLA